MVEISEVIGKVNDVVFTIDEISHKPVENSNIESMENEIKSSFDLLKEGKTRYVFTLSSRQYKNGSVDINLYWKILTENIKDELEKGLILLVLKEFGSVTSSQITEKTNVLPERMYGHIVSLLRDGEIKVTGETEDWLIFSLIEKEKK